MPKVKYPIFKGLHRGQGGFTLIELLVVIAILGVIAAVVLLNVGGFMGAGAKEAANTEAHQVQTAAIAYLVANSMTSYATTFTIGPGIDDTGDPVETAYLMGGPLQANYHIDTDGAITSTDFTGITNSKWGDLEWSVAEGWHEPAAP
jgi:type IV pilus assembly protein PilA